jgi:hypothetical protein
MRNLSNIGQVFFGISIAGIGFLTIYYHDFPYMLIPPKHSWIPGIVLIAYTFGALLMVTGACIIFKKQVRLVSLLLGSVLLLIFSFYFIPYQVMVSSNYMHFGDWENAAKELALASGAFVIAGCFSEKDENRFIRFLGKLIPFGAILFSVTIISFGIDHYLYAKEVADYVPSWVPAHLSWIYFTGTALLGSGLVIILKIKPSLAATLLGAMIFSWVIILHLPRVIASPIAYIGSEVASTFLALAYSGIAFVIASTTKDN